MTHKVTQNWQIFQTDPTVAIQSCTSWKIIEHQLRTDCSCLEIDNDNFWQLCIFEFLVGRLSPRANQWLYNFMKFLFIDNLLYPVIYLLIECLFMFNEHANTFEKKNHKPSQYWNQNIRKFENKRNAVETFESKGCWLKSSSFRVFISKGTIRCNVKAKI